jgi:hypothetical protein
LGGHVTKPNKTPLLRGCTHFLFEGWAFQNATSFKAFLNCDTQRVSEEYPPGIKMLIFLKL